MFSLYHTECYKRNSKMRRKTTTRIGRKPIAKSKRKSHRVTISLTPGQFRALKALAKRTNDKISAAAAGIILDRL